MALTLALVVTLWVTAASLFALLGAVIGRGAWRRRPGLPLLMAASGVYALGYSVELTSPDLAWTYAALALQYLGIATYPALILLVTGDVVHVRWLRHPALLGTAAAVGAGAVGLVATNPTHALFHANARLEPAGPLTLLAFDAGPGYVVFQLTMAAAFLVAIALLTRSALNPRDPPVRRAQARLVLLGGVTPWLAGVVTVLNLLPVGIDLSPFAFAFTALMVYVAVHRHAMADVSPIARALVVDRMLDPVFVVDDERRLVDHNERAEALLASLDVDRPWLGAPLAALIGHDLWASAGVEAVHDPRATVVDVAPIALAGASYDARIATGPPRRCWSSTSTGSRTSTTATATSSAIASCVRWHASCRPTCDPPT